MQILKAYLAIQLLYPLENFIMLDYIDTERFLVSNIYNFISIIKLMDFFKSNEFYFNAFNYEINYKRSFQPKN